MRVTAVNELEPHFLDDGKQRVREPQLLRGVRILEIERLDGERRGECLPVGRMMAFRGPDIADVGDQLQAADVDALVIRVGD